MDDNTCWVLLISVIVAGITIYRVVDRVCCYLTARSGKRTP